jgi:hypothetical protein
MIKRLIISLLITLPVIGMGPSVMAESFTGPFEEVCTGAEQSTVCQEKENKENPLAGTNGLLLRAARFISMITAVASIIIIIYGGVKFITASGDANTIGVAKSTITYALVGLVASLMAQGIVVFVINRLD